MPLRPWGSDPATSQLVTSMTSKCRTRRNLDERPDHSRAFSVGPAERGGPGFSLLAWRAPRPDAAQAEVAEIADHARAGRLRTAVHARLPLTEAPAAHRILEDRSQLGRVLLVP